MSATKPAEVYSVRMWLRVMSGVRRGEEYLILCWDRFFCMAMFVKCVWMCELDLLECCGMVLRSSVYSA